MRSHHLRMPLRLLLQSWRWDLNPRPADYKSAALPTELRQLMNKKFYPALIMAGKFFVKKVIGVEYFVAISSMLIW